MIESILYTITLYVKPFIVVSIVIFIIGLLLYHLSKKFNIHKKSTRYIGLLTGMNKIQIVQLSAVMIRTILVIYAVIDNEKNIEPVLIMLITSAIFYIILTPRKAIFEIINILGQATIIYFISIIHNYRIEISNENYILQIEIILMVFIILYAIYFLLKNIEDIVKIKNTNKKGTKKQKNRKKNAKKQKLENKDDKKAKKENKEEMRKLKKEGKKLNEKR